MNVNTPPKSPGRTATTKQSASGTLADQARDAADAVTNTINDAIDSGQAALSHAGVDAKEMSDIAFQQIKTFAEAMTLRNPLGAVAGAVVVGFFIGLLTRGRSSA